jgi:phosphohistidine phosphatase
VEVREIFAASGKDDNERSLTAKGERRMRRVARGLRAAVDPLDVLATSPLMRATETARIVSQVYGGPEPLELDALAPGHSPDDLAVWLEEQAPESTIALVGHEPNLGEAITWFVSGRRTPFLRLGKAGACLLEFPHGTGGGRGVLSWLLRPGQLRKLR